MELIIFVLGLAIGSFLNVLIRRLPKKESILGYSKCPECKKRIPWPENIPVLSFIFLKGRCRSCGAAISWQYPVVELSAGFLFFLSFLIYGEDPVFLVYVLFLVSLFLVIAFIDFNHFIIPDSALLAGFLVSFLLLFLNSKLLILDSLLGLLFFAGVFLFIFLISKGKWLGLGDVKLGALLGFIFGFRGAVDIFYLTFLIGAVSVIILLSSGKAGLKTEVPLGSMLALAAVIFLVSGFSILDLIWPSY